MKKLSTTHTNTLFQLYQRQPWLQRERRHDAVSELLELCDDFEQQSLVCELLNRFEFLDDTAMHTCLRQIVSKVQDDWRLREDDTQFVASTGDLEADSAQAVLYALKPELKRAGWARARTTNHALRAHKLFKSHPHLVLVDEFAGTGKTLIGRVKHLRSEYANAAKQGKVTSDFTIRICLIACMEQAFTRLKRAGIDVYSTLLLRKGISAYYKGPDLCNACKHMIALEKKLSPSSYGVRLPNFGYGKAQALYGSAGNAPNSVFPIFWWSHLQNGTLRSTILERLELAH